MPRNLGAKQIPTAQKDDLTALAEVPGNSIHQAASEADIKPGTARKIVAEAHQRADGQEFVTREPTLPHIAMAQTLAPLGPSAGNASRMTPGKTEETPKPVKSLCYSSASLDAQLTFFRMSQPESVLDHHRRHPLLFPLPHCPRGSLPLSRKPKTLAQRKTMTTRTTTMTATTRNCSSLTTVMLSAVR